MKDVRPIERFKVMEWVRSVRANRYNLYKNNPEEYNRQLREAGTRVRRCFGKTYSISYLCSKLSSSMVCETQDIIVEI